MDSEACKRRLLEAIEAGDWEEAHAALEDLREWTEKGGFPTIIITQTIGRLSSSEPNLKTGGDDEDGRIQT